MEKMEGFDESALAALRQMESESGSPFVDEVIQLFLKSAMEDFARVRDAVKRRDAAEVARLAHHFKSSCFSLGAIALGNGCLALEAHGKRGNLSESDAVVESMASDLPRISAELKARLRS